MMWQLIGKRLCSWLNVDLNALKQQKMMTQWGMQKDGKKGKKKKSEAGDV